MSPSTIPYFGIIIRFGVGSSLLGLPVVIKGSDWISK